MKFIKSIIEYFSSVVSEVKKISFPSRKQVITDSTVVICVIIISIFLIGLYDGTISGLIKNLILEG